MNLARTGDTETEGRDAPPPDSDDARAISVAKERRDLEEQLKGAFQRAELSLHYQPQFELPGVRMVGSEALLRWYHPRRGMISPGRFIPIAEQCGLIVPIGAWVLEEACRQNYHWQQAGYDPIRVAVNVSAQQFTQVDFVSTVAKALAASGLEPRFLELELAEKVLMGNVEESAQRLANLKALGVSISMDDFGTGVLSLGSMVRLPVDNLKIDITFVRDMNEKPATLRLVKAILALGHSLGIDVTAEGVETEEQLEQLRQLGCDKAQGYLFGGAVPAGDSEVFQTPASGPSDRDERL